MKTFLLIVPLVVLVAARAAYAAPTLDLVAVNGIDPSTGYLTDLPQSATAGHAKVDELATCAKLVKVDYKKPSAVLADVYIEVNESGTVTHVDTTTDPSTHIRHKDVGKAAPCIARIVKGWTFPDHGTLLLRFALINVPVKRAATLPKSYVASLAAVCAVKPSGNVNDDLSAIQAALSAHPDASVQSMLGQLGGYVPATRAPVLRAIAANAGIESCSIGSM